MNVPQRLAPPRQVLPDALRGIALAGIVLVNAPFLAVSNDGLYGTATSPADSVVAFLVVAFAQGKFYLLFAFLFGYSAHLMMPSASTPGPDGRVERRRFARRLVGLFVLGAIHAVFFFIGDILMGYAVIGVVLLAFAARSTRAVLAASAVAAAVGVVLLASLPLAASPTAPLTGGFVTGAAALDEALRGGFLEGAAGRLEALPDALVFQAAVNLPLALAMFLLGLAAARHGVLAQPERFPRLWRGLGIAAVVIGLPGGLLAATFAVLGDGTELAAAASVALGFGTAPALTGGYVALAVALRRSALLRAAVPAGRMSLTGYLGESVVFAAIFCGWGLGLFGLLPIWAASVVGLVVWALLDVAAKVWLGRYRYGPVEWVLRMWTRGERVPLRRRSDDRARVEERERTPGTR